MTPPDELRDSSTAREVAGYLRCSDHDLPAPGGAAPGAGGAAPENARTAALSDWRAMRRAELVADAAAAGETITAWYEDFAVSGMEKAGGHRAGFRQLQRDVQAGLLGSVYTRDLSRVFRDLLQQELWFTDMERRGVAVHAQDLATEGDADTRRLLRQQIGSVHEYYSRRLGALWQAARMQSFAEGRWVGRAASCWGLRYDAASGGFESDAGTADRAAFVFETFVACAGIAHRTAVRLNALHRGGEPRATLAPTGTPWKTNLVLNVVRSCLYRRRTALVGVEREAPELIPAVLPAALVAQADALLAARQPYYDRCRLHCEAERRAYTLRGLIRCRSCGAAMQAARDSARYPHGASLWASWQCPNAATAKTCAARTCGAMAGTCGAALSVPQGRALALVGRGVRQALEDYGMSRPWVYGASWAAGAAAWLSGEEQAVRREARGWRRAEAKHRSARAACLQAYAGGAFTDPAALRARLDVLDGERAAWREARRRFTPPEAAAPLNLGNPNLGDPNLGDLNLGDPNLGDPLNAGPGGPVSYGRWRRRWHRLAEEELCGTQALFAPLHPKLRAFLQESGASVEAEMADRPPKPTDKPGSARRHSGLLTVVLRLPGLDHEAVLTETPEDLQRYGQWRSEQIKAGRK